jgi:hypothetical protein
MEDTRIWIFHTADTLQTVIFSAHLSQLYIIRDNLQATRCSESFVMHSPGVQSFIITTLF